MQNKPYKKPDAVPETVNEPETAYQASTPETALIDEWNPNVPFHGTQEEWWEHFHKIEEGEFMSFEEYDNRFEAWKKDYLAIRM